MTSNHLELVQPLMIVVVRMETMNRNTLEVFNEDL